MLRSGRNRKAREKERVLGNYRLDNACAKFCLILATDSSDFDVVYLSGFPKYCLLTEAEN
jgi:hypothetical protein